MGVSEELHLSSQDQELIYLACDFTQNVIFFNLSISIYKSETIITASLGCDGPEKILNKYLLNGVLNKRF